MSDLKVEQRDVLLHLLRNPSGWSEDAQRDVRNRAADELERLWEMERMALVAGKMISRVVRA